MKIEVRTLVEVGVAVLGVVGIAKWVQTKKEVKKATQKFNDIVEEKVNDKPLDIDNEYVGKAMIRAIEKRIAKIVADADRKATETVESAVSSEAKKVLDAAYDSVKDNVKKQLSSQIGTVNIDKLKKEVREDAAKLAMRKLDNEMDEIATAYKNSIDATGRAIEKAVKKFGTARTSYIYNSLI